MTTFTVDPLGQWTERTEM